MALEKLGLGAILTFDGAAAVRSMNVAQRSFASLNTQASMAAAGARKMGGALRSLSLAAAPLALAVAGGTAQAASFEHQMSAVSAITGATGSDFLALTNKAKEVGASTAFSASQAAKGIELMGLAGASTGQIIEGLGGVTDLAAAGGLDLATSTTIVADTIKGMGLSFKDATKVADTLAFTSSKTNTDVRQLGFGLTFATGQAKTMGIQMPELVATLGALADAGLKGSLGGTSLTQMFVKLSKPSDKAKAIMEKWNISLTNADGSLKSVSQITGAFAKRINKIPNSVERAAISTELFGVRGGKAFAALAVKGEPELAKLTKAAFFSAGAARKMAEVRMDNLIGQLTILRSSMEGFAIELFGPLLKPITVFVKRAATALGQVVTGIQLIRSGLLSETGPAADKAREKFLGLSETATSLAEGVSGAIDRILGVFRTLRTEFDAGKSRLLGFLGPDGLKTVAKFSTLLAFAGAAIAPLGAALLAFGFLLTSIVVPAVTGLAGVLSGLVGIALGPVGLAIGIIAAAVLSLRRENESFGAFALRMWTSLKTTVVDFWNTAIQPLVTGIQQGLMPVLGELKQVWSEVIAVISGLWTDLVGEFSNGTDETMTDWLELGRTLGAIMAGFAKAAAVVFGGLVKVVATVVVTIVQAFKGAFNKLGAIVGGLGAAFDAIFKGNFAEGAKIAGDAISDFVTRPLDDASPAQVIATQRRPGRAPEVGAAAGEAKRTANIRDMAQAIAKEQADKTDKSMDKLAKALKKQNTEVSVPVSIDGRAVAFATTKHTQEIQERSGFRATPWQRRAALEHGAVPMMTGA